MPFEPKELPDKRKLCTIVKRQWQRHTTYITDIDNKFNYSNKKIAVARWQIWGDKGEKGEYTSQHSTDPSGFSWQTWESLDVEFKEYKANVYGLIIENSNSKVK
jgi:hypothetical protein